MLAEAAGTARQVGTDANPRGTAFGPVNAALAARAPFRRSVESLRAEGVRILLGPGGFQPHLPRTGGTLIDSYPWHLGLGEAERALDSATQSP